MNSSLMIPFSYRFLVEFNGRKGSVDVETYKQVIRKDQLLDRNFELLEKMRKESDPDCYDLLSESLTEGTKEIIMINRMIDSNIIYARD